MYSLTMGSHLRALGLFCALLASGCAFDVVQLHSNPTSFTATAQTEPYFVLAKSASPKLVSGWVSPLKSATVWQRIGSIAEGDVFKTKDQVLTVEASNLYQADMVIKNGEVVGFYIPTSKAFTPCSQPLSVELKKTDL